jgi:hypothetical protein
MATRADIRLEVQWSNGGNKIKLLFSEGVFGQIKTTHGIFCGWFAKLK